MENANAKVQTAPTIETKDAAGNSNVSSTSGTAPGFLSAKTNKLDGNWEQVKERLQKQWSKFTDEDLKIIEGNRKLLGGKVQERYSITQIEAEKQVDDWKAAA